MSNTRVKNKILYIEDEVDACQTMVEFLNPRGFAVMVSFTSEEAYKLLRAWNPDLIMIDIRLIGESGIDFIKKIRKEGMTTPIIVVTAYPERISKNELKDLNIGGYYIKPFSFADLYETIKVILEVV
ncbi:MAG: response regulator transcription factor [Candidatus Omnitrophica bacterium]|nr:response regulator transcription factor [Candidatus Omnitrophota bacterium]